MKWNSEIDYIIYRLSCSTKVWNIKCAVTIHFYWSACEEFWNGHHSIIVCYYRKCRVCDREPCTSWCAVHFLINVKMKRLRGVFIAIHNDYPKWRKQTFVMSIIRWNPVEQRGKLWMLETFNLLKLKTNQIHRFKILKLHIQSYCSKMVCNRLHRWFEHLS